MDKSRTKRKRALLIPLHEAAFKGDVSSVKFLIRNGADVDSQNDHGRTALFKAVSNGQTECVRILIENNADLFHKDGRNMTVLDWARMSRHREIIDILESAISSWFATQHNANEDSRTVKEAWKVVKLNRKYKDELHEILNTSSSIDSKKLAQLVKRSETEIPLEEFKRAVRTLRRFDELPAETKQWNETAAPRDRTNISSLLKMTPQELRKQAPPSRATTSWSLASSIRLERRRGFSEFWIDVDTARGFTALIHASACDDTDLITLILRLGATIDKETRLGHNALTWACSLGRRDAVQTLLNSGACADYITQHERRCALLYAAEHGHPGVVVALLKKLQDIAIKFGEDCKEESKRIQDELEENSKDNNMLKMEPEQIARLESKQKRLENLEWCDFLEQHLAQVDCNGVGPAIDVARRSGYDDVVRLIQTVYDRCDAHRQWQKEQAKMAQPTYCSLGCGFVGRADTMVTHIKQRCPKRIVACPNFCGLQLGLHLVPEHVKSKCPKRKVRCRNSYHGCNWSGDFETLQAHMTKECPKRLVKCRLLCGQEFRHEELSRHEHERCPKRLVKCPLNCGKTVHNCEIRDHIKNVCRLQCVMCPLDCGKQVRREDVQNHLEMECVLDCRWRVFGCTQRIGPKSKREIHETHICKYRPAKCPYNCADTKLRQKDLSKHALVCPRRIVPCRLHCGMFLPARDQWRHEDPFTGWCPNAPSRCPRDMIGKRFMLATKNEMSGWVEITVLSYDESNDVHEVFHPVDKRTMMSLRVAKLVPVNVPESGWQCGMIERRNLKSHLMCKCPFRLVQCDLCKCLLKHDNFESHRTNSCPERLVTCTLGCGKRIRASELWEHQHSSCDHRTKECECGAMIKMHLLDSHQGSECPLAALLCPLGCGKIVQRQNTEIHIKKNCPKREVSCPQGCGEIMWFEEVDYHLKNTCNERLMDCDDCGKKSMRVSEMLEHVSSICPKRMVKCDQGCGVKLRFDVFQNVHLRFDCPGACVPCPRGCGIKVRRDQLQDHESNKCVRRQVYCPNNCDTFINADRLEKHFEECPRAVLICPHGCGERFRRQNANRHQQSCVLRTIPCGASAEGCKRQLRSWFLGHVKDFSVTNKSLRLVRCESHSETVLGYAADSGDEILVRWLVNRILPSEIDRESKLGTTPLIRACAGGHAGVVVALLEGGAFVDQETSRGSTPLIEAVHFGHRDVVETLIRRRALATKFNSKGANVVRYAKGLRRKKLLPYLSFEVEWQDTQQRLFRAIATMDQNLIYSIVRKGEPYVLNQREYLKLELKRLDMELDEKKDSLEPIHQEFESIRNNSEQVKTRVDVQQSVADMQLRQAETRDRQVEKLKAQIRAAMDSSDAAWKLVQPVKHCKELLAIREPNRSILLISRAVLKMLEVEPRSRKSRKGTGTEVSDWWYTFQSVVREEGAQAFSERLRGLNFEEIDESVVQVLERDYVNEKEFVYVAGLEGYILAEAMSKLVKACVTYQTCTFKYEPIAKRAELHRKKYNAIRSKMWGVRNEVKTWEAKTMMQENLYDVTKQDIEELEQQIETNKQRLRVYEILNFPSLAGHTALTYAASLGNYPVVKMLLDHGAMLQYANDDLLNAAARVLQCKWRHHHWLQIRLPWTEERSFDYRQRGWRHRVELSGLVRTCFELRHTTRVPVLEAAYNGHDEVMDLLLRKGANPFSKSRAFSLSSPPARLPEQRYCDKLTPMWLYPPLPRVSHTLDEMAILGAKERGCGTWVNGKGWGFASGQIRCLEISRKILDRERHAAKKRADKIRRDKRMIRERKKMQELEQRLEVAVNSCNFSDVMDLVDQGAPVDHITSQGFTALMMAAAQGTYSVNREGDTVLSVSMLLDRDKRPPKIDRETKIGHTALSWAAHCGKANTIEVLLNHGADVNYRSSIDGKSALIAGAKNGKADAVYMLIARGADVNARDNSGKDAIEWARERNFTGVVRTLCQLRSGFLGDVRPATSNVYDRICRWGCGKICPGNLLVEHELKECPLRDVKCELCNEKVWQRDLEYHRKVCPQRPMSCKKCGRSDVPFEEFEVDEVRFTRKHKEDKCLGTRTPCRFMCGAFLLEGREQQLHEQEDCPRRLVRCEICRMMHEFQFRAGIPESRCPKSIRTCPLGCGVQTRLEWIPMHVESKCRLRKVKCKWEDCGKTFFAWELDDHENNRCERREIDCKNRCGEIVRADKMNSHLKNECSKRFVPCPSQGCKIKIRACDVEKHLKEECEMRIMSCRLECGETDILAKDLEHHETRECPYRLVPCGLGCGKMVCFLDVAEHKKTKCKKRLVSCPLGCCKRVPKDEIEIHCRHECKSRRLYCPLGCGKTVTSMRMNRHVSKCPMRMVECTLGCGENVRAMDLETHVTKTCVRAASAGKFNNKAHGKGSLKAMLAMTRMSVREKLAAKKKGGLGSKKKRKKSTDDNAK